MSLKPCKECGKEISDQADACPHCGYKKPAAALSNENSPNKSMGCGAIIGYLFAFFMVILIFFIIFGAFSTKTGPIKDPSEVIDEEQDRQAQLCKDGYASACDYEKDIANFKNSTGMPAR